MVADSEPLFLSFSCCRWCTPLILVSASALPHSCSEIALAVFSLPTLSCSSTSTCHLPSHFRMERSRHRTKARAHCSCATLSNSSSWTASQCGRRPTAQSSTVTWWTAMARAHLAPTQASVPPTGVPTDARRVLHPPTARSWATTQARRFTFTSTAITSPPPCQLCPVPGRARAARKAQ